MKTIKGDCRFLLIGTSGAPFDAPPKQLCKQFSSIIMIPRPDYASRYRTLPPNPTNKFLIYVFIYLLDNELIVSFGMFE